jgi:hypothetical protein
MSERTPPPAILPLIVANLPLDDLAPYPHCVTWDLEWRDGKTGKPGNWTKVLKNPRTGQNARSNDSSTWGTAGDVLARFDRFGYVVTEDDPFTFLDVDDGINPETGEPKPWAQAIVDALPNAYWEISTTGTGLKGLVRGQIPKNRIVRVGDGQVELFFSGKFTVLTGNRLPGSSSTIGEGQEALAALYAKLCPESEIRPVALAPSLDLDDRDVVERTLRMVKGRRLHQDGDAGDYASGSEADLALLDCYISAGATTPDQLDRLYRSSALYREKWERQDYRRATIAKALNGRVTPYQPTPIRQPLRRPENGVVIGKPQDAGTPLTTEPEPLAATGTDGLPDDIPSLKQIIRDLTRRVEVAERRAQDAERKAEMLSRVQSTTARIVQNKALGQERFTAVALAHRFANLHASGNTGERGLHPITLKSVGEAAGVSEDAASKHIGKLVESGVLRKELRWVPGGIDLETGEITTGHKRQYIGPAGENVIDFVEAVASLQPEKPKTWGGRADRCRPCTEHPNADVIKRVTFHCAECDQELGRLPDVPYEASGPDPQDADYQSADPLAEREVSVVTPRLSRPARVSNNEAEGTTVAAAWLAGRSLPGFDPPLPDHLTDVAYGARR